MYASSFIARSKAALQGSETEQRIAVLLYDDSVQVISTFELNQLASLTYHEGSILTSSRRDMIDIILEHLEQITTSPINYSIVSVQKAVVVTKHLLLHGAEKVVPCIIQQLGRPIDMLRQYNTVLAAQQQSSSTAWILRLKGGAVDTAGPVRELAEQIFTLINNTQRLQFERCSSADPNSLVPIGDRRQVAFVTDEVRLEQLKKRMQEEQSMITRSNLAKASDGFGSGYMSANGKMVVGAAHGIEEMLKQKQKEEQRFSDASSRKITTSGSLDSNAFSEYLAPDLLTQVVSSSHENPASMEPDLLSLDPTGHTTMPVHNVDLLDFGSSDASSFVPQMQNLQQHSDLLMEPTLYSTNTTAPQLSTSINGDPFHHHTTSLRPVGSSITSSTGDQILMASFSAKQPTDQQPKSDRFAALDALASGVPSCHATSTTNTMTANPSPFADLNTAMFSAKTSFGAPRLSTACQHDSTLSGPEGSTSLYHNSATTNIVPLSLNASRTSSIRLGQQFGGDNSDHDGSGFLMGGSSGTGLDPIGQAPSSAPPPPPSGMFYRY